MNGATTLVLKEMIAAVEKRRPELESSVDLRQVTVTVTMKAGTVRPYVRFTTTNVECGGLDRPPERRVT